MFCCFFQPIDENEIKIKRIRLIHFNYKPFKALNISKSRTPEAFHFKSSLV